VDTVARLFKIEKAEELWKMSLIATLIPLALLILVYFPSVESMVKIWNRSDTYAHGFMIVPLFLWLVWRTRDVIKSNLPDAIPSITVLSALFGFVWVIAYLTDIQVAHQLLFVAIVQVIIVSIYGWHVARILAFPLIFLFFAVPMGEELVPVMIEFTADFTVGMVNLVGVPVYREGNYFELPTGRWSVVEACSGVRYLIASVALGFLYSYLTYSSLSKRTIFILVSIIVPIVANGVRAFLIVMIGHLSGMTLATGVDHLVYGWLFFGIVVGVMFFIGSYWRDEVETESVVNENSRVEDLAPKVKKLIMSSAILSLAIIVPPLGMGIYTQETHSPQAMALKAPQVSEWEAVSQPLTDWHPHYVGLDGEMRQTYHKSGEYLTLYVAHYRMQRSGSELVNSSNVLVQEKEEGRRVINTAQLAVTISGSPNNVFLHELAIGNERFLVASYYIVDSQLVVNRYKAKLLQAKVQVLGGDEGASYVAVAAPLGDDKEKVKQRLAEFISQGYGVIKQQLQEAGGKRE